MHFGPICATSHSSLRVSRTGKEAEVKSARPGKQCWTPATIAGWSDADRIGSALRSRDSPSRKPSNVQVSLDLVPRACGSQSPLAAISAGSAISNVSIAK